MIAIFIYCIQPYNQIFRIYYTTTTTVYRNYHLHRLGAGKATGTINAEDLAMKASASARPAGGVELPRDVIGQEFLGQDGEYPPYCRCP